MEAVLDYRLIIPVYGGITFITIVANSSPIMVIFLEAIGKVPTLTTRAFIWTIAIKLIKNNPLLGYGFYYDLSCDYSKSLEEKQGHLNWFYLYAGNVTMLLVGITSSSMIFTLSGFVIFVLSERDELIA